ncbi:MAG: four helix bundle protein [Gammaproteobacteria bacterium]
MSVQPYFDMEVDMQTLEPIRAWSRACHLVIDHYQTAKSCEDDYLRNTIIGALLALPVKLAESAHCEPGEEMLASLSAARTCCAQIKTHLYIARELRLIESFASDKFLVESMDVSLLIEKQRNLSA